MKQIIGYINFPGNTREAMNFYRDCLGGDLQIMSFGQTPGGAEMSEEAAQGVMHSSLTFDGFSLMASDVVGPEELKVGNNISLMIACSNEEEIYALYDKLSAGGSANHPVQKEFWGDLFGHLTDKFGINWLLNLEQGQSA